MVGQPRLIRKRQPAGQHHLVRIGPLDHRTQQGMLGRAQTQPGRIGGPIRARRLPKPPSLKRIRGQLHPPSTRAGEHRRPLHRHTGGEHLTGSTERRGQLGPVFAQHRHHHRLSRGQGLLDRASQTTSRAGLDEVGRPKGLQMTRTVREAHRPTNVVHPVLRRPEIRAGQLARHVRHQPKLGLACLHPGRDTRELLEHRLHQRRMKRMRDRQLVHPPTLRGEPIRNRICRGLRTGDHHRFGRVDRSDPHTLTQQRLHLVLTGSHRHHRTACRQRLHQPAPRHHQHRRVRQRQHTGRVRRRQLSNGVTHDEVRKHTPIPQHRERCHLHREQRGLSKFGAVKQIRIGTPNNVAQRQPQMPVQLVGHRIECLRKHGQLAVQLAAHPDALRALPRKHDHRLAHRPWLTDRHAGTRLARREPSQPGNQLLTACADHHRSVLKHRATGQRAPHIDRIQPWVGLHVGHKSTRLRRQRLSRSRRNHPRHHRRPRPAAPGAFARLNRRLCGGWYGGLFQDQMRVGAADPKGGHRRPARTPVNRPLPGLGQHRHRAAGPIHPRGRLIHMQRRRHHPMTHRLHHLDHPGDPRGGLGVAHVRLD